MLRHYQSKKAIQTNYSDDLQISAGLTGVTVLKSISLKSRFSKSTKFTVSPRGVLQKIQKPPKPIKKKNQHPIKKFYTVNKSRVSGIILNFINAQKGQKQLFFYTITFHPGTSDNVAFKCLNSWLTSLRHAYKLKNYLWITERQKNGTIHFHIAIKEYLPIQLVNNLMKKLLHYYIRKGELNWNHVDCSRYNGVHISKNQKTGKVVNFAKDNNGKAISLYLTKYIGKGTEQFKRQAWQSSKSLTALFLRYNLTYAEFENDFLYFIDHQQPIIEDEFFLFYKWIKAPPPEIVYMLKVANRNVLNEF